MKEPTFEQLWALKPEQKSQVKVYNKELGVHEDTTIFRSYRSYLQVPEFDPALPKSYMYDGCEPAVPNELIPYLLKARDESRKYNQMVVNWYEPEDYMQPHRDCDTHFDEGYYIGIYTINEPGKPPRLFEYLNLDGTSSLKLEVKDGWHFLSTYDNRNFRHMVHPGEGRRVSITFRMLKE